MAQPPNDNVEHIISIHGLWMPGFEMVLLRRRLSGAHGFSPRQFSYRSMANGLEENIRQLRRFIEEGDAERSHIVAHSLGGVVALHALQHFPGAPIDRVVCLGSPLTDSAPARVMQRYRWGRLILGRTLVEGVLEHPLGEWAGPQSVGVIAGTVGAGVGTLVADLDEPHDGVVASSETRLPGIADHLEMPVNHLGLVFSSQVAEQAAHFLRDGCFARA